MMEDGAELCFPLLLNRSCRKPMIGGSPTVFLNVSMAFLSPVTMALNLLVIVSVSHFRRLHTPTNILILSLAVSDFLVGLVVMPGEIYRNTSCWRLGDVLCVLFIYVISQTVPTSVGSVALISVDRYVAICQPLRYHSRITVFRVRVGVSLCWLFSALFSLLYVNAKLIKADGSCLGQCAYGSSPLTVTFDIISNFFLPVFTIVVLYVRVFVAAVSQARAMRSQVKAQKSELKAARTLGILVMVYLICFCPYYFYSLAGVFDAMFGAFLVFLICLNSCLNPLIYALFYPWFRKAVKLILTLQILKPGSQEVDVGR